MNNSPTFETWERSVLDRFAHETNLLVNQLTDENERLRLQVLAYADDLREAMRQTRRLNQ